MRVITCQNAKDFADRLVKMDPRVRRGFLDSAYARIAHGESICDADAIQIISELLYQYGFKSHGIKLAYKAIPDVSGLVIDAVATHFAGAAEGYQVLSIGRKLVNSGPGWSVYEPVCAVVVPTDPKYKFGEVLPCMPIGAIPVNLFFFNRQVTDCFEH